MLKRVIGFMFLVASAHSAAALTSIAATDPLNADVAEDTGVGSPAAPAIWAGSIPSALRRSMTLRRTYSLAVIKLLAAAFSIATGRVLGHRICRLPVK